MKKVVALHIITTKAWEISPSSYGSLKPRRFVPHWNLFHCLKTRDFLGGGLFSFVSFLFVLSLLLVVGWLWFYFGFLYMYLFFKCYTLQWSRWVKLLTRSVTLGMKKTCSHLCSP